MMMMMMKHIPSLNLNPVVVFPLYGRHIVKSIWLHNSAADCPITTKFGTQMQNVMSITILLSKWRNRNRKQNSNMAAACFPKPEVVFISAVDWDISSKFSKQIDFHLLKQMLSLNLKPGVDFQLYGRHMKNSIWRHDSATDRPISTKFGGQM